MVAARPVEEKSERDREDTLLITVYNLLIPGSFCPGKEGEKKKRRLSDGGPQRERERESGTLLRERREERAWAMAFVFASFPISHDAVPSCIDSMGTETGSGAVPRTGIKLGTEGGEQSNDL